MLILRDFKIFHPFLVIATLMVSLAVLPWHGYCNDTWVQAEKNENNVIYYNPASVKIDKEKNIIDVSTKWVFTEKGKIDFSKNIQDDKNIKLKDIDHSIIKYSFNYKEWKCNITNLTEYNQSGKELYTDTSTHEWRDIPPKGIIDSLLKKLLRKYNLRK